MKKTKENVVRLEGRTHNWVIGMSPDVPGGSVLNRRTGKWEPRIYWCTRCDRLLDIAHSDAPGRNVEMATLARASCTGA